MKMACWKAQSSRERGSGGETTMWQRLLLTKWNRVVLEKQLCQGPESKFFKQQDVTCGRL